VRKAGKRAVEWLRLNLKESANGFEEHVAKAIAAEGELAE